MSFKFNLQKLFIILIIILFSGCSFFQKNNLNIEEIDQKLSRNGLSDCFEWLISNEYSSHSEKEIKYCNSKKEILDELFVQFQKQPQNNIPCNYSVPFVYDGCQGENCFSGYHDDVVKRKVDLMSEIINGKKIETLKPNEKLSQILEYKILVNKLGKYKFSTMAPSIEQFKKGINVYSIISYDVEGNYVACFDKELVPVDLIGTEVLPYTAENWIYIETQNKKKGYIPFSALF